MVQNQSFQSTPSVGLHPLVHPLQSFCLESVEKWFKVQRRKGLSSKVDEEMEVSEEVDDVVVIKILSMIGQCGEILKMAFHGSVLDGESTLDVEGELSCDWRRDGDVDEQIFDRQRSLSFCNLKIISYFFTFYELLSFF